VTADCLKLTSYFGERHRSGRSFTADALIELYGRHEIAASILLRGTEGFGLKHHLRTDRSLTLSEDLPLIAIAVDTRSRIETVLAPTVQLNRTGLVTLERARLLTDVTGPGWSAEDHEAAKLTVYLGRQERVDRIPAFIAVCDLLHRRGIDGATALLGVDGTAHGRRQRAAFFSRNAEVPMMVIAVGSGERIGSILPELGTLLQRPLLTLERVRICKRDGLLLAAPPELPGADDHGMALWHKLMVYTSEAVQYHGEPIHRAIVRRLRSAGLSGATTLRGIWGFHGDHRPHGDRLLQLGRHVPAVTIVIDTPERISAAFAVIDELTGERGLVTSETIPALRASAGDRHRGGTRLASHHLPPTPDPLSPGGSAWVGEPGRALAELRGDRFGLVRAADEGADLLLLGGEARLQVHPARQVQQPLGRPDGIGAAAGDGAGQLQGGLARVRINPGRQAQRDGLLAAHDAPGEGQFLGDVPADELWEHLAAGHVRHQAPPDLHHRQPRVRRDDADVGAERDLQAAAQRIAGHGRDDRDGDLRPDVRGPLSGGPRRPGARGQVDQGAEPLAFTHRGERAEVQARAEIWSLTGQHDRTDTRFGLEPFARRDQAGEHRPVQGIALVRPGQPDIGHPAGDLHCDALFGHHRSLAYVSLCSLTRAG
jgi:PII-like signaling protein